MICPEKTFINTAYKQFLQNPHKTLNENINENIKKSIYDLFRLTGYACTEYSAPAVDGRLYYNFLQCKADFEEKDWTYGKDFLDDIKTKYEIGVTYFHRVDGTYDWHQEKENFETWMIEN